MSEDFITMTIGKQKNIALIAHDNKKADLIDWCEQNKEIFKAAFSMWHRYDSTYDYGSDRTPGKRL